MLYADTSALAKLYVSEAGTAAMKREAKAATHVASSVLVWHEMRAMLARRRREGRLTGVEHAKLTARFKDDFAALLVVELDGRVLEIADQMVADLTLRSADAVHLASARMLDEAGMDVRFACSDGALLAAARAERMRVFEPS